VNEIICFIIKSTIPELVSTSNTFSYVLAYKLLQQSLKHGPVIYREVNELLTWSHIGCDIYSIVELENFLELKGEFDKNVNISRRSKYASGVSGIFTTACHISAHFSDFGLFFPRCCKTS